jgi:hypothetical protein
MKRQMALSLICAGSALALLIRTPVKAIAGRPEKDKIVQISSDGFTWRVDLHPLGYPARNPQLQWRRGLDQFSTVDFVSDRVLAATFVTQENVAEVQQRDDPNRIRPYRLHAIFLDTASGKILKSLEWPTDDPYTGIFSRYNGSFVFFSAERVVLYASDWQSKKELPLPQLTAPHSYPAGIADSPSGKVLVVRYHQDRSIQCIQLQTDTLRVSEGPCTIPEEFTVSDDAMAAWDRGLDRTENGRVGPHIGHSIEPYEIDRSSGIESQKPRLLIHKLGQPIRTFCDSCAGRPQFLNNDFIIVPSFSGFAVFNNFGVEKFSVKSPPNGSWIDTGAKAISSSANGDKFVVAFNESVLSSNVSTRFGGSQGDIPATFADRVEIYDLETERQVYNLKINKKRVKEIWGFALSPTGGKLAVDSGGVIQVYALPLQTVN